ncbi:hypothetical protein [Microbacterium arborescens]|uniref:hypothetical protein n=1 Tax=Microbacterium arborescens TaxID=33883 RepID=UPI0013B3865C|nr:hypothetical protein [Microbacterium arborescens]
MGKPTNRMLSISWWTKISMSSSLRDFDRLEDRLRQHRQVDKTAILIVEGADDLLLLRDLLPDQSIFAADGKRNALAAEEALRSWDVVGVRALVDADFDEPELGRTGSNVLLYDGRDLEGMLVNLGVLSHILEHQGSAAKLSRLGGANALCQRLIVQAELIAGIRDANHRFHWGLRFDGIDIASKVDRKTVELDVSRLIAALVQHSETEATVALIKGAGDSASDGRGPRGRDVLVMAGVALRQLAGGLQGAATTVDVLGGQLRSSAGYFVAKSQWLSALRQTLGDAKAELEVVTA